MRTLLVEGWRLIPHSYAMVNQYQCLELLKRPDVRLFHKDVPFVMPHWTKAQGMWPPDVEAKIAGIPPPPPGLKPDAVLRMGFPHFLDADPSAKRTFCWGTSEFGLIDPVAIGDGRTPQDALSKASAHIITCSQWAAKGFINSGAAKTNVSVIACGVNTDIFKPAAVDARTAIRKKLGWEGKFVVLNISAMTQNKGVHLAIRAVAALIDRHPNLHLILKGSDALYNSSQFAQACFAALPQADVAKLATRVGYAGATMSEDSIVELYQAADAYLSPYRAEGFNLPVLEAAACGLPVICTRGGSTDDFVDDRFALRVNAATVRSSTGHVTLEPDFNHLVQQLERIITDAGYREQARSAGPGWVRSKFTWTNTVDQLLELMFAG